MANLKAIHGRGPGTNIAHYVLFGFSPAPIPENVGTTGVGVYGFPSGVGQFGTQEIGQYGGAQSQVGRY